MIYSALVAPFAEHDTMLRGLVSIVVLAFGIAPVGVFLILRRMSLMGDAMSHAILPGVAAGFVLSGPNRFAMSIGGLIAGLIVALLSGAVARVTQMREDASLAVFYLVSLALGVVIVSSHGTNLDLLEILFGNIQALDQIGLQLIAFNSTVTLVVLALIYRPLVIECVDPLFLRTMGSAGAAAHFAFLALVVVNLVSAFHALGALLAVGNDGVASCNRAILVTRNFRHYRYRDSRRHRCGPHWTAGLVSHDDTGGTDDRAGRRRDVFHLAVSGLCGRRVAASDLSGGHLEA